jgi:hypothetical protein
MTRPDSGSSGDRGERLDPARAAGERLRVDGPRPTPARWSTSTRDRPALRRCAPRAPRRLLPLARERLRAAPHALRFDGDQERRGRLLFSAKQRSWRTAWRARSLLSWTKLDSDALGGAQGRRGVAWRLKEPRPRAVRYRFARRPPVPSVDAAPSRPRAVGHTSRTVPSSLGILDRAHGPILVSPHFTRTVLALPHSDDDRPSAAASLPPFPSSSLLIPLGQPLPLAAAPPPASLFHAWAAPVLLAGRGRGPSAKRWTPLPRKPRREAESGPEAGRRPVRLLRRTPRDEHPETNTNRRTGLRLETERPCWHVSAPSGAAACPVPAPRSIGGRLSRRNDRPDSPRSTAETPLDT